jgi:hypothetical protein
MGCRQSGLRNLWWIDVELARNNLEVGGYMKRIETLNELEKRLGELYDAVCANGSAKEQAGQSTKTEEDQLKRINDLEEKIHEEIQRLIEEVTNNNSAVR